jgi:simple sugar transport system permease protein
VIGTLLGAVVLSVMRNGFTLQGISADTFNMILGLAILVAMIMNQRLPRLRKGMMAE